mgnify:CR=1 FL=1
MLDSSMISIRSNPRRMSSAISYLPWGSAYSRGTTKGFSTATSSGREESNIKSAFSL